MGQRWTARSNSLETFKVLQTTQVAYPSNPSYLSHTATQRSGVFFRFKMSTIKVYVAISDDGGVYKHWALFLDEPEADETLLNARGSDGRFRYETEKRDVRHDQSLVELVYLCSVDVAKANMIRDIARSIPVHNEISGWNCQDYVLDLLDELEVRRVMGSEDEVYRMQRTFIAGKQEGLA
ncbi:hypothetical protein HCH54_007879 [Aspergillus fumigatus]